MPEIFTQPWMQAILFLALSLLCYLIGCTNGAIVFSKLIFKDDVRNHGSGNAGLTNFYRTYGPQYALLVIAVDMLKTVLCMLFGKYWAGLFCIVGHMYPVTEKFKGGKGVLSSGTVMFFLGWKMSLCVWGAFLVQFVLFRYVSLGSVTAAVVFPIATWFIYGDWRLVILAAVLGGLVIFAHRSNIGRLLKGTENKFKFRVNKVDKSK